MVGKIIINIIGCDGAGKTTVINHCSKWLRDDFGFPTKALEKWVVLDRDQYPECTFINAPESLFKKCISLKDKESRFLFFIFLYATVLKKTVPSNKQEIVFLDGYWHKHYAYERLLGNNEDWMKQVCSFLPQPDLTILFNVDPRVTLKRKSVMSLYECGLCAINENNYLRFQTQLRNEFLMMASTEQWLIVDANSDLKTVITSTAAIINRFILEQQTIVLE